MAALLPVAGSTYTYTYATLGEIFAWMIGWDLILEYAMGAATVAVGWSGYVDQPPGHVGIVHPAAVLRRGARHADKLPDGTGTALFNLPAAVHHRGADHGAADARHQGIRRGSTTSWSRSSSPSWWPSSRRGVGHVDTRALASRSSRTTPAVRPFRLQRHPARRGRGVLRLHRLRRGLDRGAGSARPQTDMPIGILGSLAICTILYVLVAAVLTGLVPYTGPERARPDRQGRRRDRHRPGSRS